MEQDYWIRSRRGLPHVNEEVFQFVLICKRGEGRLSNRINTFAAIFYEARDIKEDSRDTRDQVGQIPLPIPALPALPR